MKLVIATSNAHKRDEIAAILDALDVRGVALTTLRDYPNVPTVEENGATFAENARLKAVAVSKAVDGYVLADDSGIVVDALDGAPGIHSARYAGDRASDADRIGKLLSELRDVPDERRTARFVCAMTLARRGEIVAETEGVCEGRIAAQPRGDGGFGYDPVFLVPEYEQTMAEVGSATKNRISHRAKALAAMRKMLTRLADPSSAR
jgi:XTP/dITP diphosphohydrolase